jgi:hypothetical protein
MNGTQINGTTFKAMASIETVDRLRRYERDSPKGRQPSSSTIRRSDGVAALWP